jgi:hypothetical protein
VSDHYAYLAADMGCLEVLDIANPASPRRVARVSSGNVRGVAVSGAYAYLAAYDAGLEVVNILNPASPQLVGGYRTSGRASSVAVSGNLAYLGCSRGLVVVDITNPANPRRLGECSFNGEGIGVAVSGNRAYVTANDHSGSSTPGQLLAIDISDPASPQLVGRYCRTGYNWGVALSQGRVFLCADADGLLILEPQPCVETRPCFESVVKEGRDLRLGWEGHGPARLQHTMSLTNPDWQDLPGYEGTNTAALPLGSAQEFFRLAKP